ncbi:MAG: response regulator transcription factor [Bacteroidota bacterium]
MGKIKIGIIDDHQAIAQGVASELRKNPDFDIQFIVYEKTQIIDAIRLKVPDVLVMDVVMPGSTGIDSFKEVLQLFPKMKIIAYTALNSPMMIEMMFRFGVKGYLNKNHALSELNEAVLNVFYDRVHLPEEYQFILKKLKGRQQPEELSKREIEILELIALEKKSNEIAELLQISLNTVETHRRHLFEKLQVSNLAGLIKAAMDQGYIK